ncbi:MAG: hypothetical protein HeimC2_43250 [Candidatus Heimdallarchaeota archaeon LC_2]|nr:MAG: hypothetical protein HeimC2_43250 [Candidatus Heimdallarchaeota archaeon LC_2]
MNGCEFCGKQDSDIWIKIQDNSRLFCSKDHGIKFQSILNSIKFHAGWSTVDMLISKKKSQRWNCKAFRGMAELEFDLDFDSENNIITFEPIFKPEE